MVVDIPEVSISALIAESCFQLKRRVVNDAFIAAIKAVLPDMSVGRQS